MYWTHLTSLIVFLLNSWLDDPFYLPIGLLGSSSVAMVMPMTRKSKICTTVWGLPVSPTYVLRQERQLLSTQHYEHEMKIKWKHVKDKQIFRWPAWKGWWDWEVSTHWKCLNYMKTSECATGRAVCWHWLHGPPAELCTGPRILKAACPGGAHSGWGGQIYHHSGKFHHSRQRKTLSDMWLTGCDTVPGSSNLRQRDGPLPCLWQGRGWWHLYQVA